MPREWLFGARSRGSPKKCATAEPPPVPAELTDAFVDRASIDWTALSIRTHASDARSILENLRFLDSIRTPVDLPRHSAAPAWHVRCGAAVLALAAIQTACGLLVLALSFAAGTPPVDRTARIAIALAFASGTALLTAVSTDRRRLFLLTAFACTAAAFTRGALAGLPADRIGALGVVFRGLLPEAFIPAALWQFALLFPGVRRFTPFDVAARQVAALVSLIGLLLFAINVVVAYHLPGAAAVRFLSREDPGRLFWHVFVVATLPAIATVFVRARRAPLPERRKVAHLAVALGVGTAPLFFSGLLRMLVPAVEEWFRVMQTGGRVWMDAAIVSGLAATPLLSTVAIVADRPFDGPSILGYPWRDRLARAALPLLVLAPFAAFVMTLYRLRHLSIVDAAAFSSTWLPVAAVSSISLLLLARRLVQRVADDTGGSGRAGRHERLTVALDRVRLARGHREIAASLARELERGISSTCARVLQRTADGRYTDSMDDDIALPGDAALVAVLREQTAPLDLSMAAIRRLLPRPDVEWIATNGVRVAAAVKLSDGEIPAVIAITTRDDFDIGGRDLWFVAAMTSAAASGWEREAAASRESDVAGVRGDADVAFECPLCGWVSASTPLLCGCRQGAVLAALPHRLSGKFLVERRLGAGAMGVVYLARDIELDRDVALKTLPHIGQGQAARLQREARAMASLNHEGLATLYGLERWRRTPVLVVEYFHDGTLAERIRSGPIERPDAIALGIRLADALAYMHANGVLHRDLKPSNIGLASSGAPKLLDFGLAALTGRSEEYPFAGTPAYLPPEAYEGAVADASFDVWALAIVLAEAIIGHHPYTTGKSRPGDVALGSDLVTFFNRALAISPDDRFQTATDVRAALMNANASR